MSDFYIELRKIKKETLIRLLNSSAKASFRKQEFMYKLWQIIEIDNKELDDRLLFYGVDKGYLPKEETHTNKGTISLERKQGRPSSSSYPINLPECDENDQKFEKNRKQIDDIVPVRQVKT